MSSFLRCSQGHVWNWDDYSDGNSPPQGPIACPLCGTLCNSSAESRGAVDMSTEAESTQPEVNGRGLLPFFTGYEILKEIGSGGMGVVYQARHIKTDRVVALKLPERLDLETRCRFATEAKAAARLSHPNIVQVYEVGEQNGRPFLALEFCPGGSLAELLDGKPLEAKPAAALVQALANAVQAAHSAEVIHRDLKPANILFGKLVDPASINSDALTFLPKIADFGLARRIDDPGQTQDGMIIGTPDYMAPEQASGEPQRVGPSADTYALGAILYELLTGRPPFRGTSMLDTLEQVRGSDPVPPIRLQPSVPRDLNTICLKCLEKEPARRYASSGELGEDLRRFLGGHPVQARPVSGLEKGLKQIRRNPLVASLAAGLCLVLLATTSYGVWYHFRLQAQRDRARYHFQMSVRSIEEMLTEVAEEDLAPEPRAELKRKALLEKALAFYEELLQVETDDPLLAWYAARAARRVGDIQRLLGRYAESLAAYERALVRLEPLTSSPPQGTEPRREVAECHTFIGEVYRLRGEPSVAEGSYRQARQIQQALHEHDADNVGYRQDLSRTYYNLGIVARQSGRPDDAIAELTEAARLLDGVSANDAAHRRHRARVFLNLGPALRVAGRLADAEQACGQAVNLLDGLVDDHPIRVEYRFELSSALINLGTVRLSARDFVGAKAALDRAQDILESLSRDFPSTPSYRAELARVCNTLAAVAFQTEDSRAADLSARAAELWSALVRVHPDAAEYHGELGISLGNLGRAKYQKNPSEAREHLNRGIKELLTALRSSPFDPAFRGSLRQQSRDLAGLLVWSGDHEAAHRLARDLVLGLPGKGAGVQRAVGFLAACLEAIEQHPEATREVDRYVALAVKITRESSPTDRTELQKDSDCAPFLGHEKYMSALRLEK